MTTLMCKWINELLWDLQIYFFGATCIRLLYFNAKNFYKTMPLDNTRDLHLHWPVVVLRFTRTPDERDFISHCTTLIPLVFGVYAENNNNNKKKKEESLSCTMKAVVTLNPKTWLASWVVYVLSMIEINDVKSTRPTNWKSNWMSTSFSIFRSFFSLFLSLSHTHLSQLLWYEESEFDEFTL